MCRVIVVTSGKGGVGKTTVTANLGLHLAKKNLRVCLVDMDIGLNNLDVVMGMESRVIYNMLDVIEGRCRINQALVQDEEFPLLFLLATGNVAQNRVITFGAIERVMNSLKERFDYILIDCPAGIDTGFSRAISCADEALVVTTPHLSAMRDADKVVSILSSYDITNMRFVVNRARGDLIKDKVALDVYEISKTLGIEFVGLIPDDDSITALLNVGGDKLSMKNASARAFGVLADNVHNGTKKLFDCTYKYRGFFGGVLSYLKKHC